MTRLLRAGMLAKRGLCVCEVSEIWSMRLGKWEQ